MISSTAEGGGPAAAAMPSRRAAQGTVPPGMTAPSTTTPNTTSSRVDAPATPASTGNRARMMGTAPRRPTQPTNSDSRHENRNGRSSATQTSGRATSDRNSPRATPVQARSRMRDGNDSSPSTANMVTWLNQARASWKWRSPAW